MPKGTKMAGKQVVNIPGIKTPSSPFSHVVRAGNLLLLTSQLSADLKEGKLIIGDITEQTRQVRGLRSGTRVAAFILFSDSIHAGRPQNLGGTQIFNCGKDQKHNSAIISHAWTEVLNREERLEKTSIPIILLTLLLLSTSIPRSEAWSGVVHLWISEKSVNLTTEARLKDALTEHLSQLEEGATYPDRVLKDFVNHVYHPADSYGGAPKAITKWCGFIAGNLSIGDNAVAAFSCGVVLHYLSDVSNPLHTGSSTKEDKIHTRYETAVNNHLGEMVINSVQIESVTDLETYVKGIAEKANQDYSSLVNQYYDNGWNDAVEDITERSLRLAITSAVSVWLYAFQQTEAPAIAIPGFPVEAVAIGLLTGIFIVLTGRKNNSRELDSS